MLRGAIASHRCGEPLPTTWEELGEAVRDALSAAPAQAAADMREQLRLLAGPAAATTPTVPPTAAEPSPEAAALAALPARLAALSERYGGPAVQDGGAAAALAAVEAVLCLSYARANELAERNASNQAAAEAARAAAAADSAAQAEWHRLAALAGQHGQTLPPGAPAAHVAAAVEAALRGTAQRLAAEQGWRARLAEQLGIPAAEASAADVASLSRVLIDYTASSHAHTEATERAKELLRKHGVEPEAGAPGHRQLELCLGQMDRLLTDADPQGQLKAQQLSAELASAVNSAIEQLVQHGSTRPPASLEAAARALPAALRGALASADEARQAATELRAALDAAVATALSARASTPGLAALTPRTPPRSPGSDAQSVAARLGGLIRGLAEAAEREHAAAEALRAAELQRRSTDSAWAELRAAHRAAVATATSTLDASESQLSEGTVTGDAQLRVSLPLSAVEDDSHDTAEAARLEWARQLASAVASQRLQIEHQEGQLRSTKHQLTLLREQYESRLRASQRQESAELEAGRNYDALRQQNQQLEQELEDARRELAEALDLALMSQERDDSEVSKLRSKNAALEREGQNSAREAEKLHSRCAELRAQADELKHQLWAEKASRTAAESKAGELRGDLQAAVRRADRATEERDEERRRGEQALRDLEELRARERGLEGHARDIDKQFADQLSLRQELETRLKGLEEERHFLRQRVATLEEEALEAVRRHRQQALRPILDGAHSEYMDARFQALHRIPIMLLTDVIRQQRDQIEQRASFRKSPEQARLAELRVKVDNLKKLERERANIHRELCHAHGSLRGAFANMNKDAQLAGTTRSARGGEKALSDNELRRGLREVHHERMTRTLIDLLGKNTVSFQDLTRLLVGKLPPELAARAKEQLHRAEAEVQQLDAEASSPRSTAMRRGPMLEVLLDAIEEWLMHWAGESTARVNLEREERWRRRSLLMQCRNECSENCTAGPGSLGIDTVEGDAFATARAVTGAAAAAGVEAGDLIVRIRSPLRHFCVVPSRPCFLSGSGVRSGVREGATVELWVARDPTHKVSWQRRLSALRRSFPTAAVEPANTEGALLHFVISAAPLGEGRRKAQIAALRLRLPYGADPALIWSLRCDPAACAEVMHRFFSAHDTDHDGQLDFDQFVMAHRELAQEAGVAPVSREENFADNFAVADTSGDGLISETEFLVHQKDLLLRSAGVA